jgi:hypothetical protein
MDENVVIVTGASRGNGCFVLPLRIEVTDPAKVASTVEEILAGLARWMRSSALTV